MKAGSPTAPDVANRQPQSLLDKPPPGGAKTARYRQPSQRTENPRRSGRRRLGPHIHHPITGEPPRTGQRRAPSQSSVQMTENPQRAGAMLSLESNSQPNEDHPHAEPQQRDDDQREAAAQRHFLHHLGASGALAATAAVFIVRFLAHSVFSANPITGGAGRNRGAAHCMSFREGGCPSVPARLPLPLLCRGREGAFRS